VSAGEVAAAVGQQLADRVELGAQCLVGGVEALGLGQERVGVAQDRGGLEKAPSLVASTGTVLPPPAMRAANWWMIWMWRRSSYRRPARSSAQRAFSQKWLIGIVTSLGRSERLIGAAR